MLFTYTYLPHKLEKLQEWLEHLVKDVWCQPRRRYSLSMLQPEFRAVVLEVKKASQKNDFLAGPIQEIHDLCRDKLTSVQRTDLKRAFRDNVNIEALCAGIPGVVPVTHDAIAAINPELANKLKEFCTNLWQHVRKLKPVSDRLGTLGEHFKEFRKTNHISFCPYCGLARIEGVFSEIQEDYDHFLPKGTYPFNSVAMQNLAPICDKCNKKFKLQQDPLHGTGTIRRKTFYSYSKIPHTINMMVSFVPRGGHPVDPRNLHPDEVKLDFESPGSNEELSAWKEIFSIESRYKDILCQGHPDGGGGGYWIDQVLGEMLDKGYNSADALAEVIRAASRSRWADASFLKVPFLNACQTAGLIR